MFSSQTGGFCHLLLLGVVLNVCRSATSFRYDTPSDVIQKCSVDEYLCDPEGVLDADNRTKLELYLRRFPDEMPFLCRYRSGGLRDQSKRLVLGVVFLPRVLRPNTSGSALAERLRKQWHLGTCPGNDVLILVVNLTQVYFAFGPVVRRTLNARCVHTLALAAQTFGHPWVSLRRVTTTLSRFYLNPCLCRACASTHSWFKVPTMLLFCACLLTWMSVVGRRAYLSRMLPRPAASPPPRVALLEPRQPNRPASVPPAHNPPPYSSVVRDPDPPPSYSELWPQTNAPHS